MGRKGGNKKGGGFGPIHHRSATLRQQRSGIKINASENVPSVLRLEHLKNLANWAGGEASIPPLAALFGHRLSSVAEEIGVPLDASLFPCQRCVLLSVSHHNCCRERFWISCWCIIISMSTLCALLLAVFNIVAQFELWCGYTVEWNGPNRDEGKEKKKKSVMSWWFLELLYFYHFSASQTLSWTASNHNLFFLINVHFGVINDNICLWSVGMTLPKNNNLLEGIAVRHHHSLNILSGSLEILLCYFPWIFSCLLGLMANIVCETLQSCSK